MKKLIVILILCFALFVILCSIPLFETHISGIENYRPADSTLSLSLYLFPGEDFLDRFVFDEGDYQYHYNGKLADGYATAFSVLQYSSEQYKASKEYCIQQFASIDDHQYQVGNWTFIEHLCYTSENEEGKYIVACQYPKIFNMYAYNDIDNTLLFLGYYTSDPDDPSTQLALTDFEAFYNTHYGQYYTLDE
ncbi:MAG: hypothetical protein IJ001_09370 [Oscillospiraceae bacterium]|nr:hypothetical protein [Oscillospiraceae bacterium]